MAFETLALVEGQDASNRARYWIYERLRESDVATIRVDFGDVAYKTVFNFVSGGRNITVEKLSSVANALNCDVVDLFRPIPNRFERVRSKQE